MGSLWLLLNTRYIQQLDFAVEASSLENQTKGQANLRLDLSWLSPSTTGFSHLQLEQNSCLPRVPFSGWVRETESLVAVTPPSGKKLNLWVQGGKSTVFNPKVKQKEKRSNQIAAKKLTGAQQRMRLHELERRENTLKGHHQLDALGSFHFSFPETPAFES